MTTLRDIELNNCSELLQFMQDTQTPYYLDHEEYEVESIIFQGERILAQRGNNLCFDNDMQIISVSNGVFFIEESQNDTTFGVSFLGGRQSKLGNAVVFQLPVEVRKEFIVTLKKECH